MKLDNTNGANYNWHNRPIYCSFGIMALLVLILLAVYVVWFCSLSQQDIVPNSISIALEIVKVFTIYY